MAFSSLVYGLSVFVLISHSPVVPHGFNPHQPPPPPPPSPTLLWVFIRVLTMPGRQEGEVCNRDEPRLQQLEKEGRKQKTSVWGKNVGEMNTPVRGKIESVDTRVRKWVKSEFPKEKGPGSTRRTRTPEVPGYSLTSTAPAPEYPVLSSAS
ncbi:hypothetical protein RUM43_011887 [Polyplax serrata]|uniref:Uncharacterized protein n=1 Tax=Polyplax serrata TaxID=468196 RepID=A0AAN8S7G1_POLSC